MAGEIVKPPRSRVRQLLGLNTGTKVAFDARGNEVMVSRVEASKTVPSAHS